jgi:tetratricopeptide (TPR) repeat protein
VDIRPRASHLLTPIYLVAVAGLLLNDHFLKAEVPGFVTGKLSDFLGLFSFAVFLSVVFPRWPTGIHVAIAVAFVFWKSPASDVAIQAWNAAMPFRIARVVDYGDLTALSVLPLSIVYLRREWWAFAPRTAKTLVVAAVSLFAFTATSQFPGESQINRGKEHYRIGEYDRAIQEFDRAIQEWSRSAEAYHYRGLAKLKLGDTAGGEADILTAASIDPKYASSLPGRCSANC